MAHVRKHPVTGKAQVRWRDPATQRERTKTFDRATDARAFKAEIEHEINRGLYIDRSLGKTLFHECAAQWIESKVDVRNSTWARDESYLRNHVITTFGRTQVGAISKADIQSWVRRLQDEGLAAATIRQCYLILKNVLDDAVDHRLIGISPCRRISLPRIQRQECSYLDPSEVHRLATAIDPLYESLVYSAAYLGCRWGELVGLKRQYLDLEGRRLRIVGSLEEVGGAIRYVEETKTRTSRRSISVPAFLVELLDKHLKSAPERDFVFVSREGALLRRNNFRRRNWKPALMAAGSRKESGSTISGIHVHQSSSPREHTRRKSSPGWDTRPSPRRWTATATYSQN